MHMLALFTCTCKHSQHAHADIRNMCMSNTKFLIKSSKGIYQLKHSAYTTRTSTMSGPYLLRTFSGQKYLWTEKPRTWYGASASQVRLALLPIFSLYFAYILRFMHKT